MSSVSKKIFSIFFVLFLLGAQSWASPSRLAFEALGPECIIDVEFKAEGLQSYRIGVGAAVGEISSDIASVMIHGKKVNSEFLMGLKRNDGQRIVLPIKIQFAGAVGVGFLFEGLAVKAMMIRPDHENGKYCIKPMSIFESFTGVEGAVGAAFLFGLEIRTSYYTNGNFTLALGPSVSVASVGAFAGLLIEDLKIRPRNPSTFLTNEKVKAFFGPYRSDYFDDYSAVDSIL